MGAFDFSAPRSAQDIPLHPLKVRKNSKRAGVGRARLPPSLMEPGLARRRLGGSLALPIFSHLPFEGGMIFIRSWCRPRAVRRTPMRIPSWEGQKASAFGVGPSRPGTTHPCTPPAEGDNFHAQWRHRRRHGELFWNRLGTSKQFCYAVENVFNISRNCQRSPHLHPLPPERRGRPKDWGRIR